MIYINLTEFGLLVKALRRNCKDENGKPMTRESLSEAIHLTPNQLGRLERGDRKYLDTQTLQLLAKALNLTNLEQREFFIAAIGQKDKHLFNHEKPEKQLNNLIHLMEKLQVPAFAMDPYGDIVAVNTTCLNLFLLTPELIDYYRSFPIAFNNMYYMYSSDLGYKDLVGPIWKEAVAIEILLFRRSTLRYRHTDYFNYVFQELNKFEQFDIDWYTSHRKTKNYDLTYEFFEYDHPRYGPLSYIASETIVHTQKGELYLIIYNPADQVSSEVFRKLKSSDRNHTIKLACWPEKRMT